MAAAPSHSSPPPQRGADHLNRWIIAIAMIVGAVMEALDTAIANVALRHIRTDTCPSKMVQPKPL